MSFVPRIESDKPEYQPNRIRVFAVQMKACNPGHKVKFYKTLHLQSDLHVGLVACVKVLVFSYTEDTANTLIRLSGCSGWWNSLIESNNLHKMQQNL